MVTAEEAWQVLRTLVRPVPSERLSLHQACGRVLAEPIRAETPLPPFSRSLVDGYALRLDDLRATLPVCGTSEAGRPFPGTLPPGGTVRIFTGAAVPEGATHVVMQEDVDLTSEGIRLHSFPGPSNIQRKGEDAEVGQRLLAPGTRIEAGQLALLASLGKTEVTVSRRVRLSHLLSGDELASAGDPLSAGKVYDVNGPMMAALWKRDGIDLIGQEWVPDVRAQIEERIEEWAPRVDVLVLSGGLGPGKADFVREIVTRPGWTVHFQGVRIRPGKPLLCASRGDTLVFGLPGNPGAHLVLFWLFVKPLLDALSGLPFAIPWETGRLRVDLPCPPLSRETFWPVTTEIEEGSIWLRPLPWTGSASVTILARAQGFARLPCGRGPFAAKEMLSFLPLA